MNVTSGAELGGTNPTTAGDLQYDHMISIFKEMNITLKYLQS